MPSSTERNAILQDLNEPQRRAVMHRDGPLLVLAGPGSGKTRVITRRTAQLVHSGAAPHSILAITFTNKAADEMKRRIDALGVAAGMWIYTFHALGVRLLREFGERAGVRAGFTIYDETDQRRVVKDAMQVCGVRSESIKPEVVAALISREKNALRRPAATAEHADYFDQRTIARLYEAYESLMRERNAVDFDDLLLRVALLLRDEPEIAQRLSRRFCYVLIDEYQDTNRAQYVIARELARSHHNICATGDPDQSIYGWRGADIGNILEFERDYPDTTVVRLEQNYRSTGCIMRVASRLIHANTQRKHKQLWTENEEGPPVQVWKFAEGRDEAERIAETIARLHTEEDRPYSDFAVFYRINAISRGLEEALRYRDIRYKIARGVEFYNRKEIRDAIAYLRLLVNPADDVAFLRAVNTPARGIGKTTIERLRAAAAQWNMPLLEAASRASAVPSLSKAAATRVRGFGELIDELRSFADGSLRDAVSNVLKRSGLEDSLRDESHEVDEDRVANVQELVTAAARFDADDEQPTLESFLQRISLTSDQDAVDQSAGVVLLMTLHAAKGLEFPVVFIAGVEQGLLPHERAIQEGHEIEEERRLCFVGITRARQRLYITHAAERFTRGQRQGRSASQFLRELPDDAAVFETFGEFPRRSRAARRTNHLATDDDYAADLESGDAPARDVFDDEPVFSPDEPTGPAPLDATPGRFRDWASGMLVQHEHFGVGKLLWIQRGAGRTRASVQFVGLGPKTFVLEFAPIQRLARDGR